MADIVSSRDNLNDIPRAYAENQRPPCPFYGFNGMFGRFMDAKGNGCALIVTSHAPCRIEVYQKMPPDWDKCPYNTPQMRESFAECASELRIYPVEFRPPNSEKWDGISFREWLDFLNKIHGRHF